MSRSLKNVNGAWAAQGTYVIRLSGFFACVIDEKTAMD
jgi:hypothetical protein